ncbi:MAG: Maf family protein, partial [Hyphomonadaceae bacterium]
VEAVAIKPNVDEEAARAGMRSEGMKPSDQAMQLAELKALKVSSQREGLVIGGDQMLSLDNLTFDKPADITEARDHLRQLSGQTHRLETALVIAEDGRIVWRHLARPALTMRQLSGEFIDDYLALIGDEALETVGPYKLESSGIQLFEKIDGDFFSILGLPLLPLLDYLRTRGAVPA